MTVKQKNQDRCFFYTSYKKKSEKFGSLVFKPSESILEPQFTAITATLVEVFNIFDHLI